MCQENIIFKDTHYGNHIQNTLQVDSIFSQRSWSSWLISPFNSIKYHHTSSFTLVLDFFDKLSWDPHKDSSNSKVWMQRVMGVVML